jgi:predicted O-linked N-acetylglucosamine transferase (SPINDLY family)
MCDLFLDTPAFVAHTTGSDALWAGLPFVTIAGLDIMSKAKSCCFCERNESSVAQSLMRKCIQIILFPLSAGHDFAARVAAGLAVAVGMPHMIARDESE